MHVSRSVLPLSGAALALCLCSCEAQRPAASAGAPFAATAAEASTARAGTDWPWFLGPTHDSVSTETGLLAAWPADGPLLVWEKSIGTGYTAPSVMGERLVLHHRLGDEEIVECLAAGTGESLWSYKYPSRFVDPYGYNNGPRCAPLLTETHCYTFGAEGKLLCLALDSGEKVWMRDVKSDFHAPDGFFGVGATPILEGDRLIVLAGGQPNAGVVALDPRTGETLWQSVGQQTWDGAETGWSFPRVYEWQGDEMVVSYSSPIAATFHGRRHVLCLMRQGLVSVDPETGTENFHYWFSSRDRESVNAARPVVVGDTILLSAAYKVGSVLLRVAPDGKSVSEVWRDADNLQTHWSTAIYHDGCYYGFSGRHDYEATMRCIDALTGRVVWDAPGSERDGADFRRVNDGDPYDDTLYDTKLKAIVPNPFYGRGSAVMADGRFIILSEYGTLALVPVDPGKWSEISRFKVPRMHYPSWPAPVLSRGRVYLRCEDWLVCYNLRGQE